MTAADRQARSRAARREAGCVRVSVTLSRDAAEALRVLTQYGATETAAINQALRFALTDVAREIGGKAAERGIKPEPFVAGIIPDQGKTPIETSYVPSEGLGIGTVTPAVRWREELSEDRSSTKVTVTSPADGLPVIFTPLYVEPKGD